MNYTERKTGIVVAGFCSGIRQNTDLSSADQEQKNLRFWLHIYMIKTCIAGMKVMAAFAVHIAMHILAMVASAISFLIVNIAKAISLTGMAFFSQAITLLQTIVVALGAGLGVWGVINLLEGYGNDNPGAKSQGIKQLMAGVGVALVGTQLVPLLSGLFA